MTDITPAINDIKKATLALANMHQTHATATQTINEKKEKIANFKREMTEATHHIGEEGYRDLNRIASDLKRVSLQLETIQDNETNYDDKLVELSQTIQHRASVLIALIKANNQAENNASEPTACRDDATVAPLHQAV